MSGTDNNDGDTYKKRVYNEITAHTLSIAHTRRSKRQHVIEYSKKLDNDTGTVSETITTTNTAPAHNNNTDVGTNHIDIDTDGNYALDMNDDISEPDSVLVSDVSDNEANDLLHDGEGDLDALRARIAEQERLYQLKQRFNSSSTPNNNNTTSVHNTLDVPVQSMRNISQYSESNSVPSPHGVFDRHRYVLTPGQSIDTLNDNIPQLDQSVHTNTIEEHDLAQHDALRQHQQYSVFDYNTTDTFDPEYHTNEFVPKLHPIKVSRLGERYQANVPDIDITDNQLELCIREQYLQSLTSHDSTLEGSVQYMEYTVPPKPLLLPGQQLPITKYYGLDEADYEHLLPPLSDDEYDDDDYSDTEYERRYSKQRGSNDMINGMSDIKQYLCYSRATHKLKQLNQSSKHRYSIAVVGCTISSLIAARELIQYGFDVELYDIDTSNHDAVINDSIDCGGELYHTTEINDPIILLCHQLGIHIEYIEQNSVDQVLLNTFNISNEQYTTDDIKTVQQLFLHELNHTVTTVLSPQYSTIDSSLGELLNTYVQQNSNISDMTAIQQDIFNQFIHTLHNLIQCDNINHISAKHFAQWYQRRYMNGVQKTYRIHSGPQLIIDTIKTHLNNIQIYHADSNLIVDVQNNEHDTNVILTTGTITRRYDFCMVGVRLYDIQSQTVMINNIPPYKQHAIEQMYQYHSVILPYDTTNDTVDILRAPMYGMNHSDIKHEDSMLYNYLHHTVYFIQSYTELLHQKTLLGDYYSGIYGSRQLIDVLLNRHYTTLHHDQALDCVDNDSNNVLVRTQSNLFTHYCSLCQHAPQHRDTSMSQLIGPFQSTSTNKHNIYVHELCIQLCNEIVHIQQYDVESSQFRHQYYNLIQCIDKSRYIHCTSCARPGATVSCCSINCTNIYHTTCSLNTAWSSTKSDQMSWYLCPEHRPYNIKTEH